MKENTCVGMSESSKRDGVHREGAYVKSQGLGYIWRPANSCGGCSMNFGPGDWE